MRLMFNNNLDTHVSIVAKLPVRVRVECSIDGRNWVTSEIIKSDKIGITISKESVASYSRIIIPPNRVVAVEVRQL